jgi:ABC-type phosphate/phosphonate transport system substrate-binding protein
MNPTRAQEGTGEAGQAARHRATRSLRNSALLALVILGADAPMRAAPGAETGLRVGFSTQLFREVNESDARASLKIWAQTLGSEHRIPVNPTIQFISGMEAIRNAFINKELDAITMTTTEYWELKGSSLTGPKVILGMVNGKPDEEYLLLVRSDSPATTISDLRGKNLAIQAVSSASISAVWLESLLLDGRLGTAETFWPKPVYATKPSGVVLPVFFRKLDGAVVTREGFRTMSDLNPQISQQMKVLAQSPSVIVATFCFRRDLVSPYVDKLISDLGHIESTTAGRQTLALFHTEGLIACPSSALDETCALLDRHQRLLVALNVAGTGGASPPADGAANP